MTTRYLTVLGTGSQVGTRSRGPGGYALRWDDQLILFDPAEGFAHRCLEAGVAIGKATAVCITHFHGDHCLGLPGIIQRRYLSQCEEPLPIYYPSASQTTFTHLLLSSIYDDALIDPRPIGRRGVIGRLGDSMLISEPLRHKAPTIGYRIEAPAAFHFDAGKLAGAGLVGSQIGQLASTGRAMTPAGEVDKEDLGEERPGQAMAFLMDTRLCGGALRLARDVDLLVTEATYLDRDRLLAERGMHLTARQAAWLARESGATSLVISHFSARYDDVEEFEQEAREVFPPTVAAADLGVYRLPPVDAHRHAYVHE